MSNIDELQAGRELDALVAEKVMGWRVASWRDETDGGSGLVDVSGNHMAAWSVSKDPKWRWSPSTDISAAWRVVEKLNLLDEPNALCNDPGGWMVSAVCFSEWDTIAQADTAPLAICRAALKVVQGGQ